MELSPRMRAVADWVPDGARLADIGTDHGLLPVWLLQQGRIERAIAADLRSKPLESARRTASRYGLTERISFRQCDGLEGIAPEETDLVVIAGMGGETIANILQKAPWTLECGTRLILQPQSAFPELRSFLCEYGYFIEHEKNVCEGDRLYVIMSVRAGKPEVYSSGELWVGKQSHDPLRGAYLNWMGKVLEKIMEGRKRAISTDETELAQMQNTLKEIRAMEKEWQSWRSQ